MKLYKELNHWVRSRKYRIEVGESKEMIEEANKAILRIMKTAPHGSGFDVGIWIDLDKSILSSNGEQLVFHTEFHHLSPEGFYVGWTSHTIKVTPSFSGHFRVNVSGRNYNDIKEHIAETMDQWLVSEV